MQYGTEINPHTDFNQHARIRQAVMTMRKVQNEQQQQK